MAIVNGYLTADEARAYVGANVSIDPTLLEDVVTSVSRMIDRHCGRHFYQATATARIFDSRDGYTVQFGPYNDLVSVTTLKADSDGNGTYDRTIAATDYQLLPVGATTAGPIAKPYTSLRLMANVSAEFPQPQDFANLRQGLIEITGTWGWPTAVPTEVKQAARIIVAEVFKLKDAPLGIAEFAEFGGMRVGRQLPARAADLLAPYRHPMNYGLA